MAPLKTPKPATARHGAPASKFEQLSGQLYNQNNRALIEYQARRLTHRFAISLPIATVIALLHHGEGAQ